MNYRKLFLPIVVAWQAASLALAGTLDLDQLNWSVQYMTDQSQTVLGLEQFSRPRNVLGLAISPEGRYLYAGYSNPVSGYGVRKIDLNQPDYNDATLVHQTSSRGKAIAVDDRGRVYLADGTSIQVYDADLSTLQLDYHSPLAALEGVAVSRIDGQLVLYASNRNSAEVSKLLLTETGGAITAAALDPAFGTGGVSRLTGEISGIEVDSLGRIWVAGLSESQLFVLDSEGKLIGTISGVAQPIDIGFDGGTALVSQRDRRTVQAISVESLSAIGSDVGAPLASLDLTATPLITSTATFGGIVVVPGRGFWVAGNGINTAGEKSTYGRIDDQSGYVDSVFYTDRAHDDNDAILFATSVPEPATTTLLMIGLAFTQRPRREGMLRLTAAR